jgi:hypothetical protein
MKKELHLWSERLKAEVIERIIKKARVLALAFIIRGKNRPTGPPVGDLPGTPEL